MVSGDLKLDGLKVYVNGTGVNIGQQLRGVLCKGATEKLLKVILGDLLSTLSLNSYCHPSTNV